MLSFIQISNIHKLRFE
uniref:Uncharacterized protein n=1 Tax=Rhizophora mucronata TaxID=61149 RepID=A0A2P2QQE6_RHIMU